MKTIDVIVEEEGPNAYMLRFSPGPETWWCANSEKLEKEIQEAILPHKIEPMCRNTKMAISLSVSIVLNRWALRGELLVR